ncbi:MAG: hypothetical protein ACRYFB_09195 [Janthinobacterium lividum]
MVFNFDKTEKNAFNPFKKVLQADSASLMLALTEQDKRLYFAYCITHKKFIYKNAAFKSFFGQTDNASPETFLNFVHPDDVQYLKQCLAKLQPGIVKNNIEFSISLAHKKKCRLKLSLLYNNQPFGESTLIGYAEEVTHHKVCNAVLEEYYCKKKAILNILSHDLLSPMGSIHNLAALLSRKSALQKDPEVNKWVSLIEVISKKSINMIRTFVEKEFVEPETLPAKKD